MILKGSMQHWRLRLYKVHINGDTGLTLVYFTTRSNLVACAFEGKNCYKVIKLEELVANYQINRRKKIDPNRIVCSCPRFSCDRAYLSPKFYFLLILLYSFFQERFKFMLVVSNLTRLDQ